MEEFIGWTGKHLGIDQAIVYEIPDSGNNVLVVHGEYCILKVNLFWNCRRRNSHTSVVLNLDWFVSGTTN